MMDLLDSDAFLKDIMDATAALAFPHFGFGGWKEHYTGYCPVWRLSYALPLWASLIEQECGWGLQLLFRMKPGTQIPYPDADQVRELFAHVVKRAITEQRWQPILDIVREMPCDEDFEKWDTNARKDFLRRWYHTRSKKVQTVSLEGMLENSDDDSPIFHIPDPNQNVEEYVIAKDFVERFLETLPLKDRQIVELRQDGFTYEEIADKLGYKNHSGVIKRVEAVKKKLQKYRCSV
ncbi:RNA polymerase sigma factor [Intestinimonas butyriciproducens]|uniref:RNA polymerase sigma factor n=1 Tax=Intestinimonas butyriciproducens TaxID=1297617 RepID=UPI002671E6FB|nr:sigma factor-like helix-turn-helix DNA-binding protein [Intestinimonas butyriciproducens]